MLEYRNYAATTKKTPVLSLLLLDKQWLDDTNPRNAGGLSHHEELSSTGYDLVSLIFGVGLAAASTALSVLFCLPRRYPDLLENEKRDTGILY